MEFSEKIDGSYPCSSVHTKTYHIKHRHAHKVKYIHKQTKYKIPFLNFKIILVTKFSQPEESAQHRSPMESFSPRSTGVFLQLSHWWFVMLISVM